MALDLNVKSATLGRFRGSFAWRTNRRVRLRQILPAYAGRDIHVGRNDLRQVRERSADGITATFDNLDVVENPAAHAYDRAMRRRFAAKDAVSWLVLGFLARPAPFEYAARRLATRPDVRATMGLVMGDLVPASRALDPRFLASLLAP